MRDAAVECRNVQAHASCAESPVRLQPHSVSGLSQMCGEPTCTQTWASLGT